MDRDYAWQLLPPASVFKVVEMLFFFICLFYEIQNECFGMPDALVLQHLSQVDAACVKYDEPDVTFSCV